MAVVDADGPLYLRVALRAGFGHILSGFRNRQLSVQVLGFSRCAAVEIRCILNSRCLHQLSLQTRSKNNIVRRINIILKFHLQKLAALGVGHSIILAQRKLRPFGRVAVLGHG
ncbi:hypothetical protein D3C73_1300450 [compost metagenome]